MAKLALFVEMSDLPKHSQLIEHLVSVFSFLVFIVWDSEGYFEQQRQAQIRESRSLGEMKLQKGVEQSYPIN